MGETEREREREREREKETRFRDVGLRIYGYGLGFQARVLRLRVLGNFCLCFRGFRSKEACIDSTEYDERLCR